MPFKNPEARKQYMTIYNASDKYKEYRKTKITCSCGLEITNHQISEHKKTQKHIKLLNALPQIALH